MASFFLSLMDPRHDPGVFFFSWVVRAVVKVLVV